MIYGYPHFRKPLVVTSQTIQLLPPVVTCTWNTSPVWTIWSLPLSRCPMLFGLQRRQIELPLSSNSTGWTQRRFANFETSNSQTLTLYRAWPSPWRRDALIFLRIHTGQRWFLRLNAQVGAGWDLMQGDRWTDFTKHLDRGRQVCLKTERHLSANNCCKVVQIGVSRFRSKSANYLIHTHIFSEINRWGTIKGSRDLKIQHNVANPIINHPQNHNCLGVL